jgi:hypothetical protein
VEARQVFVLSDQNFPSVLPFSMGECLKIIRVEDGGLGELVNVWLVDEKRVHTCAAHSRTFFYGVG